MLVTIEWIAFALDLIQLAVSLSLFGLGAFYMCKKEMAVEAVVLMLLAVVVGWL